MSRKVRVRDFIPGLGRHLFDNDLRPRLPLALSLAALCVGWMSVIIAASQSDNTLRLPYPGRGLLNHYGFQATVLAAYLVILTAYSAVSRFLRTFDNIEKLLRPNTDIDMVRALIKPHVDSLFLHGRWKYMLWLLMIVGVAVSLSIFRELHAPEQFWGNDVFNADRYLKGFYAANSFLLWAWSFAYPIGIFYALHITLSTQIIVAQLQNRNLLHLDFLDTDKCGGMSRFGTLNLFVMLIYFWPCTAIYALHATHNYTYLSLVAGAIAVSLGLLFQSVYGIFWVSRAIRKGRATEVDSLNDRIRNSMECATTITVAA